MAQVVDADADIIEYKLGSNPSNGVHELYFIQFVNGRKTEFWKCIQCSAVIKARESGNRALHEHFFKIECRVATTRATFPSIRIVLYSSDSLYGISL